ncbi:MAG: WD40 repeat domain-containing serine/threonine protein kinase [Planctomycetota bacterium]
MNDVTQVEAIYLAAIERSDPVDQAAYLESACSGDAELRRRVDALLAAHPRVGRFLEPHADLTHICTPEAASAPGTGISGTLIAGRYKLLERIGEGGMGEVWAAEQTVPVKRKVAIKLIKVGMDSPAVLARFEAERQALAVMDHPNIARVFDGGLHEGRPFFVMELVKGVPITVFCDARKLTPRERLELFLPVCLAIQHAHMKGIIHRDIKPSNVLVALYDDRPVPKVIDFGVARAAGQTLTDKTLHTAFGAVIGTPEYMSPEQASFNNLDIDTRSDVYSLGVLLYELLTGTTPVDRNSLGQAALLEVLRIVREVEAPRPSQKLSTNATLASVAANRGMEPSALPRLMQGELDWILLKALEKDRGRRYETANGLASDIGRYLNGEAVSACPPTLGYRLKKAYRRNRVAVLVVCGFTGLVITAAVAGAILAIQARRAESLARASEQDARRQREKAEELFATASSLEEGYLEAALEAELRNNGSRLDADLLEYKFDTRAGLLRLARPLKEGIGPVKSNFPLPNAVHYLSFGDDSEFVKLREFQAAAVIAAGQEFVPLVPPLEAADRLQTSPDGRWLLGLTDPGGLMLWSIPSLKRAGLLREKDERIVRFGFSPDSGTIWTQDVESVLRFWNADGTFRARTPLRPERFIYPAGMTIEQTRDVARRGNNVLVADGMTVVMSQPPAAGNPGKFEVEWNGEQHPAGPADLYSNRTGQLIRRLDGPDGTLSDFHLAVNDRWLVYKESKGAGFELVIVSTDDGRELARLVHPDGAGDFFHRISPTGKWVIAIYRDDIRIWSSADWKIDEDVGQRLKSFLDVSSEYLDFVTDDVLDFVSDGAGVLHLGRSGLRTSWKAIGANPEVGIPLVSELGGTLIRCGRVLTEANTFRRLNPPTGRRYAAELARLAPDERFFENLDTVTEKELPYFLDGRHFPGFGHIGVRTYGEVGEDDPRHNDDTELRILPDPSRVTIPPEMLELWAQVVTGGELGSDGRFEAWDEPTWQARQKQLATMKPPDADFPFPGWAATEPNLWWRIRAHEQKESRERDRLVNEWRRRSGRILPQSEPDPWRTPGPVAEPAPMQRGIE